MDLGNHNEIVSIHIWINPNEVTIMYQRRLIINGMINNIQPTQQAFIIDCSQNQSKWVMIKPLISQALDGLGLDLTGLSLSGVTACYIYINCPIEGQPILEMAWKMASGSEIERKWEVGPERQAFQNRVVSYITHPDILGFIPAENQFSPVQNTKDAYKLVEEIYNALQARKEEQEES